MSLVKYQVHDETSQVSCDCLVILFIPVGIKLCSPKNICRRFIYLFIIIFFRMSIPYHLEFSGNPKGKTLLWEYRGLKKKKKIVANLLLDCA